MSYLNNGVEVLVKQTLKASLRNPTESAFILKFMAAAQRASKKRLIAESEGLHIPPFLIASISAQCNLFCTGCYARAGESVGEQACSQQLTDDVWKSIFSQAQELGISFVLLAGGEPFLRRGVIAAALGFPDIVFPIFTNGTLLDDGDIRLLNKNRHLVPILSLEGGETETRARRGEGVFSKIMETMSAFQEKKILFGVSITVTQQNLRSVTEPSYIESLFEKGCVAVVFVEYVPITDITELSALDVEDRRVLAQRQAHLREQFDAMLFVAFPGDEEEFGGCLAAGRGFFHINPAGGAEPCPFSPFSDTDLRNHSLKDALKSPLFEKLDACGFLTGEHLGGCVLHSREAEIKKMLSIDYS